MKPANKKFVIIVATCAAIVAVGVQFYPRTYYYNECYTPMGATANDKHCVRMKVTGYGVPAYKDVTATASGKLVSDAPGSWKGEPVSRQTGNIVFNAAVSAGIFAVPTALAWVGTYIYARIRH